MEKLLQNQRTGSDLWNPFCPSRGRYMVALHRGSLLSQVLHNPYILHAEFDVGFSSLGSFGKKKSAIGLLFSCINMFTVMYLSGGEKKAFVILC